MQSSPYRMELYLHKEPPPSNCYLLTIRDSQRRVQLSSEVDLTLREQLDVELQASEFVDRFIQGDEGLAHKEGLAFGRYLLGKLLAGQGLARLWRDSDQRRKSLGQALKVELILPKNLVTEVADIPFELLADEDGFLFRRSNNTIVRIVQDLPAIDINLSQNIYIQVAWANTIIFNDMQSMLPKEIFHGIESAIEDACHATQWTLLPHLRHVSASDFAKAGAAKSNDDSLKVLILVTHGQAGSVMMHDSTHKDFPKDSGVPVLARDLARLLRKQGYSMIWLLSCHGAQADVWLGSATESLIDPEHGNQSGVIASHGALKATLVAKVMHRLIKALDETRDIEAALLEARCVLPEGQLQWASLTYYTREDHKNKADLPAASTWHLFSKRSIGPVVATATLISLILGWLAWLPHSPHIPSPPPPQPAIIQDLSSLHDLAPLPVRIVGIESKIGYTTVTLENLPQRVSMLQLDEGVWVPEKCGGGTCSGLYWSKKLSFSVGALASTGAMEDAALMKSMKEILSGANESTVAKIAETFQSNKKIVKLAFDRLLGLIQMYGRLNSSLKDHEQCKRLAEALRIITIAQGLEQRHPGLYKSDSLSAMKQQIIADRTSRMCKFIKGSMQPEF